MSYCGIDLSSGHQEARNITHSLGYKIINDESAQQKGAVSLTNC